MEDEKIIIKIPHPPITSLIFEGGGVKGIAYAGAYKTLKEKPGLLDKLHWVAGSSAGAMTALLVALNFTPDEIEAELSSVDFSEFAGSLPDGRLAMINYIFKNTNKISKNINHGINDGKRLYDWVQSIVEKKLDSKEATFLDLKNKNITDVSKNLDILSTHEFEFKNLFVIVTNALKNKTEIFSWETTPNLKIADAVLASMSIPGYFYTRYIDHNKTSIDWSPTREKITAHEIIPYVDGGVLNNYPINIFRDYKYWLPEYYGLVKSHHYNPSSLGIRVDSKEEVLDLIDMRHHETIMDMEQREEIEIRPKRMFSISDWLISPTQVMGMANKFITLLTSDLNKVEQYCQRTIAIYDCDIHTTQFTLTKIDKDKLKESGRAAVQGFFNEYFKKNSFKEIIYDNIAELKNAIMAKNELIKILINLKDEHAHERELIRLKLEFELSKEKLLELDAKTYSPLFFQSYLEKEASTSKFDPNVVYGSQTPGGQKFKKRVEGAPEIETSTIQGDSQQDNAGLKYDDGDDDRQVPLLRRFFCC